MNLYLSNKKCLIPSNYHRMDLYLSNKKNVFNHRNTIKWTFTFQTKKCFQPLNYHTMNLYLSNKKMSSTIELPYNEPLPFKQKNVFTHRITIQWTFTFQKKMSSTIELPYNEPLPFKWKNFFNHRITIQWTFTFQIKKHLQPSNNHTMNLYLSNKKMSSTNELPYNEHLPFKQKKRLQPSNYHKMNLYLSNENMSSTIELPYNGPLPFKQKNVFNHQIIIKWTFTFQTKKCFQPSNYHTMNLYLSKKNMSSTIELPCNEPLHFN